MDSRIWKTWLAIGVMTSCLVACTDNDDKDYTGRDGNNQHAGVWVSESYTSLYSRYVHAVKRKKVSGFCADHYRERKIPAILINGDGEIFRYNARDRVEMADYRYYMFIGIVGEDGVFTDSYDQDLPKYYRYSRDTFYARAVFDIDHDTDTLTIHTRGRPARTFKRTTDKALIKMQRMDLRCTSDARYVDDEDHVDVRKNEDIQIDTQVDQAPAADDDEDAVTERK